MNDERIKGGKFSVSLRFVIIVLLVFVGLYLRFKMRMNHDFDGDESFILTFMKGSFMDLLRGIPKTEFCSYLSGDIYLIYPFFKLFGYNKWGLAIPHIIATLLGFYFLYRICEIYFRTNFGYIIAFSIFCFNNTLIKYALEVRTYAVLPTLALSVFYFTYQLINEYKTMSKAKKIGIGLFLILAIWFHVHGLVMIFLTFLYLLVTKRREPTFRLLLLDMLKFFSIVLMIALPLWCFSVFGPHNPPHVNPFLYFPNPLVNLMGFLKLVFCNLIGTKILYFLIVGLIIPFLARHESRYQQIGFFLILIVLPIELILLASVKNHYYFVQRHFIWVMPLFAFLLGWCWDSTVQHIRQISKVSNFTNDKLPIINHQ